MDTTHEIVLPTDPLPVWLYVHHNNPVAFIAPHWHQGIEVSFTLDGSIDDFTISGEHFKTVPRQLLIVNTREIHSIQTLATNQASLALSLIFPYSYIKGLYPKISTVFLDLNHPETFSPQQKEAYAALQGMMLQITLLTQVDSDFRLLKLMTLITQSLEMILRYFAVPKATKENSPQKVYAIGRLQDVIKFISDNYQRSLTLDEIAQHVNVSKEYLARFFKKYMEITVGQYLNNVRAQHAHSDLLKGKNLTQTALDNGFSGIRALNRAVANLYGKTASALIKERKK